MWRLLSLFIIVFWVSMTFLLAKKLLTPEKEKVVVPVAEVLRRFFDTGDTFVPVEVYHQGEHVGQGSLNKKFKPGSENETSLRAIGFAKVADDGSEKGVVLRWDATLDLVDQESMNHFKAVVDIREQGFFADMEVNKDGKPTFEVRQGDRVLASSNQGIFRLLGGGLPLAMASKKVGVDLTDGEGSAEEKASRMIQATQQRFFLAGRDRIVHIIDIQPTKEVQLQMMVLSNGEFVKATGPGGYEMRSALFDQTNLDSVTDDEEEE